MFSQMSHRAAAYDHLGRAHVHRVPKLPKSPSWMLVSAGALENYWEIFFHTSVPHTILLTVLGKTISCVCVYVCAHVKVRAKKRENAKQGLLH